MANGTVKWFSNSKGYGFISPEDGGNDVFAHFSAIEMDGYKTLKQGQEVSYELKEGPKGPQAHNIQAVASTSPSTTEATTGATEEVSTASQPEAVTTTTTPEVVH